MDYSIPDARIESPGRTYPHSRQARWGCFLLPQDGQLDMSDRCRAWCERRLRLRLGDVLNAGTAIDSFPTLGLQTPHPGDQEDTTIYVVAIPLSMLPSGQTALALSPGPIEGRHMR